MNDQDKLALNYHKIRALSQYIGNNELPDVVATAIRRELSILYDENKRLEYKIRETERVQAMNLPYKIGEYYRFKKGGFVIYDNWYKSNVSMSGSLSGIEHEEKWEIHDIDTERVYLSAGYSMSMRHELFTSCMERYE